jgi:hypothetical protein
MKKKGPLLRTRKVIKLSKLCSIFIGELINKTSRCAKCLLVAFPMTSRLTCSGTISNSMAFWKIVLFFTIEGLTSLEDLDL